MERAAGEGVPYTTARCWLTAGKLPVPARKAGGLILGGDGAASAPEGVTAMYARVPSADRMPGLDRQVACVTAWASGEGMPVSRAVAEAGSALNGQSRGFIALLRDESVTAIAAERRDRFARFGTGYVEAALAAQGRRLLAVGSSGTDDGLARDVTEILTSLCARLHGRRGAAKRAARALAALEQAPS